MTISGGNGTRKLTAELIVSSQPLKLPRLRTSLTALLLTNTTLSALRTYPACPISARCTSPSTLTHPPTSFTRGPPPSEKQEVSHSFPHSSPLLPISCGGQGPSAVMMKMKMDCLAGRLLGSSLITAARLPCQSRGPRSTASASTPPFLLLLLLLQAL
ncbi:hypothetical protein E2C01_100571 [Portunus trituberculatus]|uniref:Uncharacterized protein n=1 Tax=Portunus trituberculatus TaxID=210409 RepID=A0A5B7KCJ8_PORTR|nr:hypothetical protein [Portunus trituberculatus]